MKKLLYLGIVLMFASCNNNNHCGNGVQDGDETGVDCGGSCVALCPTTNNNNNSNWNVSFTLDGQNFVGLQYPNTTAGISNNALSLVSMTNVNSDESTSVVFQLDNPSVNTHFLPDTLVSGDMNYIAIAIPNGSGQQPTYYYTALTGSVVGNNNANITITELDYTTSKISGTFSGRVASGNNMKEVTNGIFTDVTFQH